jgi:uncharacterized membrane protein (DUF106 family)
MSATFSWLLAVLGSTTTSTSTATTTTALAHSIPIPESTFVLTLTAVVFSLLSNALTRWRVDLDTERRIKAEIAEWTKALRAAVRVGDKAAQEKLKKKEQSINQMRLKMSSARTKVALYTIIPFFVIYYLVLSFVGPCPVAVSPFGNILTFGNYLMRSTIPTGVACNAAASIPSGAAYVTPFGWYLISSFSFTGVIMRLMKTQT